MLDCRILYSFEKIIHHVPHQTRVWREQYNTALKLNTWNCR